MLRLLPRSFWAMLLRYLVLGLLLFGVVFAGVQLVTGLGYKARAAALEAELKEVRAGAPSSRHARYVKTANGMDFYTVDLVTEAKNL